MTNTTNASALLDKVPEAAQQRHVQRGQTLFRAGAPADHVYLLTHGRIGLERVGPAGEPILLHQALPGEYFAEAALHSEHYHCSAVALRDTTVLAIGAVTMRARLAADPGFAAQWMAQMARQLHRTRARVERLSLHGAAARLRHLLCSEGQGSPPRYALNGTLKELAAELGITHEALYRTLASLERQGCITRSIAALTLLR